MRFRFAAALGLAALLTISCGGVTDPSKNQQEMWVGTLPVGNIAVFTFNASNSGEISVVVNALSPLSNAALLVTYGQQVSGGCAPISQGIAGINGVAISSAIVPGSYCLAIQDYLGNLTVPENFTITVSHP